MSDESEMAAAKATAELAAAQTGGVEDDVVIIDPSPIESNVYTCVIRLIRIGLESSSY